MMPVINCKITKSFENNKRNDRKNCSLPYSCLLLPAPKLLLSLFNSMDRTLYQKKKNKKPCTLHPFCLQSQWEWAFEWGAYPPKSVHPPYTPLHPHFFEFNFRIGEQSFAYRRTIVWAGANNRLGVRKRLLPCLPSPVRMASIPCADGF